VFGKPRPEKGRKGNSGEDSERRLSRTPFIDHRTAARAGKASLPSSSPGRERKSSRPHALICKLPTACPHHGRRWLRLFASVGAVAATAPSSRYSRLRPRFVVHPPNLHAGMSWVEHRNSPSRRRSFGQRLAAFWRKLLVAIRPWRAPEAYVRVISISPQARRCDRPCVAITCATISRFTAGPRNRFFDRHVLQRPGCRVPGRPRFDFKPSIRLLCSCRQTGRISKISPAPPYFACASCGRSHLRGSPCPPATAR